jgi:hypothetical protein
VRRITPTGLALLGLTLVAFTLRVHALGAVPLRWDEGWSIALARLGAAEALRLTALDVHPPLYYLVLGPWLALGGAHELWVRYLSVAAATLAVPLAAVAASAWWAPGSNARRVGVAAAACAMCAPAFIYYAGVSRMYAFTLPCLFLATWGLARRGTGSAAVAILGATAALYAFYYTGFALAGLFAAALIAWPRRWARTAGIGLATALLYLPWLLYAVPPMFARVGTRTGDDGFSLAPLPGLMLDGLNGALFVGPPPAWALPVIAGVLTVGCLVARPPRWARLGLVILPVLGVLVGAALGAQAHMFAPRYTLVAAPFVVLGLGWALAGLWQRGRGWSLLGGALLLAAVWPLLTGYVYQKTAEVTGEYDPAGDRQALAPYSEPGDIVAFNILSLAGAYERYRTADDPPWTYAQVWDPVREDPTLAIARLSAAANRAGRLWLVLYNGTYSPGSAAVKQWADDTLYPVEGWWRDKTLYQGYVAAKPGPARPVGADFGHGVRLIDAAVTPQGRPDGGLGVTLTWQATGVPDAQARVFVHAYAPDGRLIAQHDALPAADSRPQTSWQAGERIVDRHGLWIPAGSAGPLTVKVGLYDPVSGQRWPLPDGMDSVEIGRIELPPNGG